MKQKYFILSAALTLTTLFSLQGYAQDIKVSEKTEVKTGEQPKGKTSTGEMKVSVPAEAPVEVVPGEMIKSTPTEAPSVEMPRAQKTKVNESLFSAEANSDLNKRLQDSHTTHYDSGLLSHLNVAIGVSTMGINIEAATPITKNLKLRAGLDFFNYKSSQIDFDIDDPAGSLRQAFGFTPTYEMKGEFKAVHGHALVDFYPFKKGIFHVTAGVYLGSTKVTANGILTDGNGKMVELKPGYEWPVIDFDGHILNTENGRLDAELTLGKAVKPYIGIGLGRTVSKKRLGFNFDIGVLYQGDYTIKQNNQVLITSREVAAKVDGAENYTKWLKLWPVINFQIHYRIF